MSQPPSGSMVFDHNAPATKQFMEQRATYQTAEYRAVQSAFFGPPRVKRSAPTPVHSGLTTPQEGTLDDEIMQEARGTADFGAVFPARPSRTVSYTGKFGGQHQRPKFHSAVGAQCTKDQWGYFQHGSGVPREGHSPGVLFPSLSAGIRA